MPKCNLTRVSAEAACAAGERQRTLLERYGRRIRREGLEDRLILALGAIAALVALAAVSGMLP
ncbi:MAG: hypothetical protein WBE92_08450 [Steroidobacteraceae bacterium]